MDKFNIENDQQTIINAIEQETVDSLLARRDRLGNREAIFSTCLLSEEQIQTDEAVLDIQICSYNDF